MTEEHRGAQARHRLCSQIEVPPARDSSVTILFLVEALTWDATQARLKVVEELNARARFFRRYREGGTGRWLGPVIRGNLTGVKA